MAQRLNIEKPAFKHFKTPSASNRLPEECIKFPTTSNNSLASTMTFFNGAKIKVKFDGGSFKLDKITFCYGNMVNVYMVYEINL